jgi:hypothetical protein
MGGVDEFITLRHCHIRLGSAAAPLGPAASGGGFFWYFLHYAPIDGPRHGVIPRERAYTHTPHTPPTHNPLAPPPGLPLAVPPETKPALSGSGGDHRARLKPITILITPCQSTLALTSLGPALLSHHPLYR